MVPALQPVSLELGGKSALIVFEDADIDKGRGILPSKLPSRPVFSGCLRCSSDFFFLLVKTKSAQRAWKVPSAALSFGRGFGCTSRPTKQILSRLAYSVSFVSTIFKAPTAVISDYVPGFLSVTVQTTRGSSTVLTSVLRPRLLPLNGHVLRVMDVTARFAVTVFGLPYSMGSNCSGFEKRLSFLRLFVSFDFVPGPVKRTPKLSYSQQFAPPVAALELAMFGAFSISGHFSNCTTFKPTSNRFFQSAGLRTIFIYINLPMCRSDQPLSFPWQPWSGRWSALFGRTARLQS